MQHNRKISIAKGIGISLMVVGHSPCPAWLGHWIYSFHMPLFFLITGFLFKEKYLDSPKKFIFNKFKGYYWPFVKWSMIFLIFHNLLAYLNIYQLSYSLKDFLNKAFYIVSLNGSEQLLGGYWFLIESFFASLIAFAILFTITKLISRLKVPFGKISSISTHKNNLIIGVLILLLIVAAVLMGENKFLIKIKSSIITASALFLIGYLINKNCFRIPTWIAFTFLLMTFGITYAMDRGLSIHSIGLDLLFLIPLSLLSILAILRISENISGWKIGEIMDFIGSNTLMILTFHFLSFKIVNLYIIFRDDLSIERLADFASISTDNPYDWILYSVIGISLPLLVVIITKYFRYKVSRYNLQINNE